MPVMPFEGLHTESYEDAFGTDAYREPTHDEADEQYYIDFILSGLHDEGEADHGDWREATYDPDYDRPSDRECDRAEDSYLRQFGW